MKVTPFIRHINATTLCAYCLRPAPVGAHPDNGIWYEKDGYEFVNATVERWEPCRPDQPR